MRQWFPLFSRFTTSIQALSVRPFWPRAAVRPRTSLWSAQRASGRRGRQAVRLYIQSLEPRLALAADHPTEVTRFIASPAGDLLADLSGMSISLGLKPPITANVHAARDDAIEYKPHKGEVPTADIVVVPAQAITGGLVRPG